LTATISTAKNMRIAPGHDAAGTGREEGKKKKPTITTCYGYSREEKSLSHAIIVVSLGISDLGALISKLRGSYTGRLLKLPCVTNVELAVMSSPGVLHLKRSRPGIMDLLPKILFQGISSSKGLLQQRRLGFPRNLMWKDQRLQKRKPSMMEHPLSALSCKIWLDIWSCN
jgi:hypothetical protein